MEPLQKHTPSKQVREKKPIYFRVSGKYTFDKLVTYKIKGNGNIFPAVKNYDFFQKFNSS
jgi:hypothetical protein